MSEDDIRMLLDMSAAERTERLIRRFRESRDSNERLHILTVLGDIGDIELTANLYIEILHGNYPHRLKFRAAYEGGMERFDGHLRLRKARGTLSLRDEDERLRRAGIQAGLKFQEIAYNRKSKTVIAYFRSGQTGRLYYRKSDSARYRQVADFGDRVTSGRMVVAADAPVLFANLLARHDDSEGLDWWGVARLNTRTGRLTPAFRQEDVKLRRPYSQGWVRELLDSWPDGRGVACVMSFPRPPTAAEKRRWRSRGGRGELVSVGEHWICDLDLERKRYKRLTELKATFY